MRKFITVFDVEEQIKSQENFIRQVERNLEEERKMLDSLILIKAHISNDGYIPLKLKDLSDAYKVNYYAMPLKNNEDIRDSFANENVLSSSLFRLSKEIEKIKKYNRKKTCY